MHRLRHSIHLIPGFDHSPGVFMQAHPEPRVHDRHSIVIPQLPRRGCALSLTAMTQVAELVPNVKNDYGMLWIRSFGKGRVVNFTHRK
jgi:hypothetical protein